MAYEELFAQIHAHNRDLVEAETWGHLGPQLNRCYRGSITFACGSYGGAVSILSLAFALADGTPLHDNPWSYENLSNYLVDWVCDQANGYRDRKPIPAPIETDGHVFTFTGSYTRFKNNTWRIAGSFKQRQIV